MTTLALLARAHFALQRVAFTHSLYPLALRSPSYARRTRCALRITRTTPWLRPFPNRLFSSSSSNSTSARQVLTIVSESSTTSSTPSSTPSTSSSSTSDLNSALRDMLSRGAVRKTFDTLSAAITSDTAKHEASLRVANSTSFRIAVRGLLRAQRPDLALDALWLRPSHLGLDIPLLANALRAARLLPKRNARAEAVEKVLAALERGVREVGDASLCNREDTKALLRMSCGLAEDGNGEGASRVMGVVQSDFVKSAGIEAAVETSEYNRAIRIFGKTRLTGLVFEVLCAMEEGQVQNDSETYEFLANAVVRSVDFVTGAVSMHTLPEALPAEVAFLGRSNVGKSSLVNMLCNRKALARVSGTPGKTQQFNYFVVNERDRDKGGAYYLVDLPGLGYAKVPKEIREPWAAFMRSYVKKRASLSLIFHLVDGRHGTMADDEVLMQMVSEAKFHGEYVIVLTKMDKLDKMKVKQSVVDKVRDALRRNGCPSKTPILLTSANTKLGRDELWKHLRRALGATVRTMQA